MIGTLDEIMQALPAVEIYCGAKYDLETNGTKLLSSSEECFQREISSVSVDSRQIIKGEACLFFALVSPSGNGHQYIPEAYSRGVRHFVVSAWDSVWQSCYPDACFLVVSDTLRSLQALAAWYRANSPTTYVFALIGSNGKTIVKEMLATLLRPLGIKLYRSPASYNSQLGVALSLLAMPRDAGYAFIEAGISEPGEMPYLAQMICPQEVIMTHFGSAHSANFPSLEALYAEKLSMLSSKSVSRLHYYAPPQREAYISELIARFAPKGISLHNAYTSSLNPKNNCHLKQSYEVLARERLLQLEAIDTLMAQNLILALDTIATALPQYYADACRHVVDISPLPMRMELIENTEGNILINDSYSNDPEALARAILTLRQRGGDTMVLGTIEQSALSPHELQAELLRLCQEAELRQVYLLGWDEGLSWDNLSIKTEFIPVKDIEHLLRDFGKTLLSTPILLIKGPRRMHLEHLVQRLSLREHDTKLSVDLSALRHNLAYYRSLLPRPASLICMIKADAYGLGAVPIAQTLVDSGHIEYLAVAVADEGKALRREGIDCPIIVMNPQGDSLESLRNYNLQAEVYSIEMLHRFAEAYSQNQGIPLHLKVDSGMHRLGFSREELPEILRVVCTYQLPLDSVFSHLAGADEERLDTLTHHQAEYLHSFYQELCEGLRNCVTYPHELPRLHLLNTAGLERFSHDYAFDGARLGIGLYGFSPTGQREVQPVVSLSTRILQVKTIPPGEGIGYGCRQSSCEARRIAVIPIGYADGFSRRYGNGLWSVELGGVLCPTVGNICMDACMIDVTAVEYAKAGDEVIIFGGEQTPLTAMAEAGGSIPYEVLTSISPRVARIYY